MNTAWVSRDQRGNSEESEKALHALERLLEECTAAVFGSRAGSGFFVAPGWLLTDAHVASDRSGKPPTVRWQSEEHEGVVRAVGGQDGGNAMWTFPDLALVELPTLKARHPCVRLDGAGPRIGSPLLVAGYADTYQTGRPGLRLASLTYSGPTHVGGGRMLALSGDEVNRGLSGGPVLNRATGTVCAVVKATRLEDSPLGGIATPVRALRLLAPGICRDVLRAHDLFHAHDERWSRWSDVLGADRTGLTPSDVRSLLGLLGELPKEPDAAKARRQAEDAYREAAGAEHLPPRDYPLLDLRDAFTDLAELTGSPADGMLYPLALVADVARRTCRSRRPAAVARRLHNAVLLAAGRAGLDAPVVRRLDGGSITPAATASLMCRLRPSYRDRHLYHAAIWQYRAPDDIVLAVPESGGLPLDEAFAWLRLRLPEQIRSVGGRSSPGLVELILPAEAMDEAVADWALWPPRPSVLGRKQHVVLRALERQGDPDVLAGWTARWDGLSDRPVGPALLGACGRQHPEVLEAFLDLTPERAAIVLAGSPTSASFTETYEIAIDSGVPLMLWRRGEPGGDALGPCGIPCGADCSNEEFASILRTALADTGRDAVPARVCELRNEAVALGPRHLADRLVVLWDDPRRQLPHVPLEIAEEGHSA